MTASTPSAADIALQAESAAKAREVEAAKAMLAADPTLDIETGSDSEPTNETTPPEKTPATHPPDPQEEAPEDLAFHVINPTMRSRKIVKIELGSAEDNVFVKEWGVKDGFDMITRVRKIFGALRESGVLKTAGEDGEDRDNLLRADALMEVIGAATSDVLALTQSSGYHDEACTTPIKQDYVEQMSIGDLVLTLRAIWAANFTHGALKNALAGLIATS